jgi:hypothetical protein
LRITLGENCMLIDATENIIANAKLMTKIKKKETPSSANNKILCMKLDNICSILEKNSKDIEELKEQVAMGKGGIKAIFVIGAFIGVLLGVGKYLKFWG